ncbi:hypothetical protein STRTUCAR8_10099 [Streptomyces turgidiscabies Car8]|uniref:Uncharacterized protein n=1 Tax=Streptomyces turgidiscabies (strain Car8) TaxID=698760 RepID=L7FFV2_STRT8|nr:hypothetical protein STRTUCAR8_10099 [Streptomyces turgidiscabies Car8]
MKSFAAHLTLETSGMGRRQVGFRGTVTLVSFTSKSVKSGGGRRRLIVLGLCKTNGEEQYGPHFVWLPMPSCAGWRLGRLVCSDESS